MRPGPWISFMTSSPPSATSVCSPSSTRSSRFSPAVDPRGGEDVVLTLKRICKTVGYPRTILVEEGSEFVSHDLDIWAYQKDVVLDFSRPGKPIDQGFIESLQRQKCLNTHWFLSL